MNLIIHGHFYQPPREDPISDYIPDEQGAEPFPNWNERILAECYAPNAHAGNFEKISFNIGPTLFNWMWKCAPDIAEAIVRQENNNFNRYGVGNGMAQGYNHIIFPLMWERDKVTQARWGVEDFEFRFGHAPQGMWLPEAAVDLETLAVLSDVGLKFTILAPWQVIPVEEKPGPYLVELPGGRDPFFVFPYDRDLSTQVSFLPKATENGDRFLQSITERPEMGKQLTLLASDGELYGHHQPFRDYFLTYILNEGAAKFDIDWTFPGRWLREHPVEAYAQVVSPSSWSCMHGVNRWCDECGCTPGAVWKKPMGMAMEYIANWVDESYIENLSPMFSDPWELRHRYIEVMHGKRSLEDLCLALAGNRWEHEMLPMVDQLLQAQYERMRMLTSCGWFFDDFHRIEPQNNIAYAAKAVWLTQKVAGKQIGSHCLEILANVKSNKTGLRADTVFSQTLIRADAEGLGQSNKESSFSS